MNTTREWLFFTNFPYLIDQLAQVFYLDNIRANEIFFDVDVIPTNFGDVYVGTMICCIFFRIVEQRINRFLPSIKSPIKFVISYSIRRQ